MESGGTCDISNHVLEWTIADITSSSLHVKTIEFKVWDCMPVFCTIACSNQSGNYFGNYDNTPVAYSQNLVYEFNWPNQDLVEVDYICSARAEIIPGGEPWIDHNASADFQSSSSVKPRGQIFMLANGGDVRVTINVSFRDTSSKPGMPFGSFASAFHRGMFTDVTLKCEDKEFPCHKMVLAGRSEVFRTMFSSAFAEATSPVIMIKEMKPDVLEQRIYYIYHDCLDGDMQGSWELFEAAKMYRLPRLANICLTRLKKRLSVSDCCQMLEAAFVHDLEDLFKHALVFAVCHKEEIVGTEEWDRMAKNAKLLEKILIHIL